MVEIGLPLQEIADGREQIRCAVHVEIRDAHVPSIRPPCIRRCAPRHEHRVVVVEVRVRHRERLEDVLIGEVAQRFAGHPLDDDGEQGKAGIAVDVLRARCEVERLLPGHDVHDIRFGNPVLFEAPARKSDQFPLIAQPAGVCQQVADGYRCPVVGNLCDVFPDVIVERQLSVPGEEHHGHGRELLRHRRHMKDRRWPNWRARLQVSHPITVFVDHRTVPTHADRAAGSFGVAPGLEHPIDPRRHIGSSRALLPRRDDLSQQPQDDSDRPDRERASGRPNPPTAAS